MLLLNKMDFLTSLLWLSLNIFFEARSEDQFSQVAVGLATINRARNRNQTIKETVLEPYSFSWVHQKESYIPDDPKAFLESVHSAFLSLQAHNFIGVNADHYHHVRVRPYWANKMSYVGTFGSHKFYRPLIKIKAERKVKYENAGHSRKALVSRMKLKDIVVNFYKQCPCQDQDDIVIMTLHDLSQNGSPDCSICGKEYTFDEEAEVWDTF